MNNPKSIIWFNNLPSEDKIRLTNKLQPELTDIEFLYKVHTDKINQITIHQIFLNICNELSELSKCVKHKVAAVIVLNNRILSTGLNGTIPGTQNCNELFHDKDISNSDISTLHREWSKNNEIHAEDNVVRLTKEYKINTLGSTLYCNLQPCNNCLEIAINAGIYQVIFSKAHNKIVYNPKIKKLIIEKGILILQISDNKILRINDLL